MINQVYNENCLDTMSRMPDDFIDLTVTSPPYDNLRDYKGYSFEFEKIAKELYRVTKKGGVVVWVVGDATVKGSETGTSFKQALYFIECGFNLHDTMIYEKAGASYPAGKNSNRYSQIFEYMFILSKGVPKTSNLLKDKANKWGGLTSFGKSSRRNKNGDLIDRGKIPIAEFGYRDNIWRIPGGKGFSSKDKDAFKHPAIFPEKLAEDHIITWSNSLDIVYDPFCGSGTTPKMSILNYRNFIGSEMSAEYCEIIDKRIKNAYEQVL